MNAVFAVGLIFAVYSFAALALVLAAYFGLEAIDTLMGYRGPESQ